MPSIEAKAVLLDLDDTLVYTIKPIWALHKHIALNHYDRVLEDDDIGEHWGKPLHELVTLLYETDDIPLAFERIKSVKQWPEFKKHFIDPTHNALQALRTNHKVGIVTAHVREVMAIEFEYLGIKTTDFDYVQTADDTPEHKPAPGVFRPALAWLATQNIAAHQTIYVGDGLHDMQAAQSAGLQFIGVETGLVDHDTFQHAGAISVADISKVPALIA